jgi:hypothetical protein
MKKLKRILLDDLEQLSASEAAKYVGGAGGEGDPPYIPPLITSSPNYDYITSFPPLGGSSSGWSMSGSSSNSGWNISGGYNSSSGWSVSGSYGSNGSWGGSFGYNSTSGLGGSFGYNSSNGLGGSVGYNSSNGFSVTGTVNYNPDTGSSSGSITVSIPINK